MTLFSCETNFSADSEKSKATISKRDNIAKTNIIQDTNQVKKWLTNVITDYVNSDDLKIAYNNMRAALTDNYYNYKQDAIDLEYGDGITENEFQGKWKGRYDTKYVVKEAFLSQRRTTEQ